MVIGLAEIRRSRGFKTPEDVESFINRNLFENGRIAKPQILMRKNLPDDIQPSLFEKWKILDIAEKRSAFNLPEKATRELVLKALPSLLEKSLLEKEWIPEVAVLAWTFGLTRKELSNAIGIINCKCSYLQG